jgi:hypothetical protein
MFVTSDIFNLEVIGRFRGLDWQENLLCGVNVVGAIWPGYEAGARFLLAAAERCGLSSQMDIAGYSPAGKSRTRNITPKSFDRLARGELTGATESTSVLLRGSRPAVGVHAGRILFGGEAGSIRRRRGPLGPIPLAGPPWRFRADFVYPLDSDPAKTASDLLEMSVSILGADYGYYFVRDDLCGAWTYSYGIAAPLDYKALANDDAMEISDWADFVTDGTLWSEGRPRLRDLFEVNLLSKRHTADPIQGLGYLTDWIAAEPGRGRLQDAGQDRQLWILTDREIVDVRPVLHQAGLLLSCRPRVYRDVPGAG